MHSDHSLILRLADIDDCMDILDWRNDQTTRTMSRIGEPITAENHKNWFRETLTRTDRVLLIGVLGHQKLGMVRFDLLTPQTGWEVSLVVAPDMRGKRLSRPFLCKAISTHLQSHREASIFAAIKPCNLASRRLFQSAGFDLANQRDDGTDWWELKSPTRGADHDQS